MYLFQCSGCYWSSLFFGLSKHVWNVKCVHGWLLLLFVLLGKLDGTLLLKMCFSIILLLLNNHRIRSTTTRLPSVILFFKSELSLHRIAQAEHSNSANKHVVYSLEWRFHEDFIMYWVTIKFKSKWFEIA